MKSCEIKLGTRYAHHTFRVIPLLMIYKRVDAAFPFFLVSRIFSARNTYFFVDYTQLSFSMDSFACALNARYEIYMCVSVSVVPSIICFL